MTREIDKTIIAKLKKGPISHRKYICEQDWLYFAIYYFPEFFTHAIPDYHFDFYDDLAKLSHNQIKEVVWAAFRESAKTSLVKIFVVWCICFGKKHYISYDSYDKGNAESALYDVAVWLQTNPKLLADFGDLYFGGSVNSTIKQSKQKRISNFITENGVKVEAFSTGESARGRIYKERRPDLWVLDDIENSKTKRSYAITHAIIEHIKEIKGGLAPDAGVVYVGNYITESGVMAYLMDTNTSNPDAIVRNIPVMSPSGEIAWPDKFVKTDKEAAEINRGRDKSRFVVSLEAKRRSMGTEEAYQTEMMNNPAAAEEHFFDPMVMSHIFETISANEPKQVSSGLKIWHLFDPSNRYGVGADTAEGNGGDSNASTVIGFGTIPAKVVATFHSNTIPATTFAFELRRQHELFGYPIIAPEVNNTGYAVVATLLEIVEPKFIYRPTDPTKLDAQQSKQYGWRTTASTKSKMLYDLKKAVESGELDVCDPELAQEMSRFTKLDLSETASGKSITRHFDLLMSAAIAWQMRDHARPATKSPQIETDRKLKIIRGTKTKPMFEEIGL